MRLVLEEEVVGDWMEWRVHWLRLWQPDSRSSKEVVSVCVTSRLQCIMISCATKIPNYAYDFQCCAHQNTMHNII